MLAKCLVDEFKIRRQNLNLDVVDMPQSVAAIHLILPMPFESKTCEAEEVEELNKSHFANHAEDIELENVLKMVCRGCSCY